MNRRITLLSSFIMLAMIVVFTASSASISAVAVGNNPSANGHGNITVNDTLRTFSFQAMTRKDGTVTGSATLHNRNSDTFIKLDINCLRVVENTAYLSGIITKSSNPSFEGRLGLFQVVDNGEGANDPPDQISLVFIYPESTLFNCNSFDDFPLNTIEGGNVQVNP